MLPTPGLANHAHGNQIVAAVVVNHDRLIGRRLRALESDVLRWRVFAAAVAGPEALLAALAAGTVGVCIVRRR